MLRGCCFWGAIRGEVTGLRFHETTRHCWICRRTTAAPVERWFSARPNEFHITRGKNRC